MNAGALAPEAAMGEDGAMTDATAFTPFAELAVRLLPHLDAEGDGAHDIAHLRRVWFNAFAIAAEEDAEGLHDREDLAAAVLLHDCVHVPKDSPDRPRASAIAAERARTILAELGWADARLAEVHHAIEAHSFSAAIPPRTWLARVLQDADRLDALGVVGVARCFYTAGRMGSALYDPADPRARKRPLDDAAFALDHFHTKLLRLHTSFQTEAGRAMADERSHRVAEFMLMFEDEIGLLDDPA